MGVVVAPKKLGGPLPSPELGGWVGGTRRGGGGDASMNCAEGVGKSLDGWREHAASASQRISASASPDLIASLVLE